MPPTEPQMPRRLAFPPKETAELLGGVSVRTLCRWRAEKKIGYIKLGEKVLYPASAIRAFLRQNEIPAIK